MKKRIFSISLVVFLVLSLCACFSSCGKNEKSYDVTEYRTTMQYHEDFKILQIADLHFGIETDIKAQLDLLEKNIDESQPDLIILTGDNFMYASKGVVKSLVGFLNDKCAKLTQARGRLTKFTLTFGNHDNQGDYPRYFINDVMSSYTTKDGDEIKDAKYAAFVDYENDNLFGLTNFYIDLVDDRAKSLDLVDVKYRIHIIDSNTYHFMGPDYDYDVIHTEQLLHAVSIYNNATKDKDYIGLAFFHIPLVEYQDAWEQFEAGAGAGQGECRENALFGYENNGAYDKLKEANIVSFFCGHDHINHGDFIYTDKNGDKAIFSYGVKATDQLYHDTDMIGYKEITLKNDVTKEEFVTEEYVKQCFKNVTTGYSHYED